MAGLSLPIKFGFGLHFVTSRSLNLNAITFLRGRDVICQAYFKTLFDELPTLSRALHCLLFLVSVCIVAITVFTVQSSNLPAICINNLTFSILCVYCYCRMAHVEVGKALASPHEVPGSNPDRATRIIPCNMP